MRHHHLATLLAGLLGCGMAMAGPAGETPELEAGDGEITAWRDRYLALGEDVYQWACAACHDEGSDGAPVTGDPQSWGNRSPLWSAVLLEHATQGFLEMPAKGGHTYLSDRAVQAAGEYMLGKTFPDKPRD
jgi:cytochrome c5